MNRSPWARRNQRLVWLAGIGAGIGLFLLLFCRGAAGLPRIAWLGQRTRRLRLAVTEARGRAALQRSDIEELKKPATVERIARQSLGMSPAPAMDSTLP
jgi:hypothetical protein